MNESCSQSLLACCFCCCCCYFVSIFISLMNDEIRILSGRSGPGRMISVSNDHQNTNYIFIRMRVAYICGLQWKQKKKRYVLTPLILREASAIPYLFFFWQEKTNNRRYRILYDICNLWLFSYFVHCLTAHIYQVTSNRPIELDAFREEIDSKLINLSFGFTHLCFVCLTAAV